METFDSSYWEERYAGKATSWDIGYVSTPLKYYFDQLKNKELKILIPGAGNSYEAEYLWRAGFKNIYLLDFALTPLRNFSARVPGFSAAQLLKKDFFKFTGTFDLIIEQTFFCALDPSLRPAYAAKCYDLLSPGGKLVGLLFNAPFNSTHPPFGGTKEEYLNYFDPYFLYHTFSPCYNSIKPREGKELFINLLKKD